MVRINRRRAQARCVPIFAVALLFGCASPQVETVQTYSGPPLPRPDRILVEDFSVVPKAVFSQLPAPDRFSAPPGVA